MRPGGRRKLPPNPYHMWRATGMGNSGGGNDGGGSCWSWPTKVNLAPRRCTPSWDSASLLSSSWDQWRRQRMVKTAWTRWWWWVMAATENDDMASTTQVNTSAMNHPNMSKFSKREVCKNYFVSVRMSDCCLQGIEPCECKGKGYQWVGNQVFRWLDREKR